MSRWIREDEILDSIHPNDTRTQDHIEKVLDKGFYVDTLLTSQLTEENNLDLIQTAISRIERYDLNLCKVQSNVQPVRKACPSKEPMPERITLRQGETPKVPDEESSTLDLQWHVKQDVFIIKVVPKDRTKTRAGALGRIGAVFDILRIADLVNLTCKLMMREVIPCIGEDDPHGMRALGRYDLIPIVFDKQLDKLLETCKILPQAPQQLYAFADNSDLALPYVTYL